MSIVQHPYELQFQYLARLDYPDIIRYCQTSRAARAICDDPSFWNYLIRRLQDRLSPDQLAGVPEGLNPHQRYLYLACLAGEYYPITGRLFGPHCFYQALWDDSLRPVSGENLEPGFIRPLLLWYLTGLSGQDRQLPLIQGIKGWNPVWVALTATNKIRDPIRRKQVHDRIVQRFGIGLTPPGGLPHFIRRELLIEAGSVGLGPIVESMLLRISPDDRFYEALIKGPHRNQIGVLARLVDTRVVSVDAASYYAAQIGQRTTLDWLAGVGRLIPKSALRGAIMGRQVELSLELFQRYRDMDLLEILPLAITTNQLELVMAFQPYMQASPHQTIGYLLEAPWSQELFEQVAIHPPLPRSFQLFIGAIQRGDHERVEAILANRIDRQQLFYGIKVAIATHLNGLFELSLTRFDQQGFLTTGEYRILFLASLRPPINWSAFQILQRRFVEEHGHERYDFRLIQWTLESSFNQPEDLARIWSGAGSGIGERWLSGLSNTEKNILLDRAVDTGSLGNIKLLLEMVPIEIQYRHVLHAIVKGQTEIIGYLVELFRLTS